MRENIISTLFGISHSIYRKLKTNKPWKISSDTLINYPSHTVGYHLGCFLKQNGFELLDKSESHDVYHVLTAYNTSVAHEIEQQFYMMGNGKKSLYMFFVTSIGLLLYPEKWKFYLKAFRIGQQALPFHQLDFKNLLSYSLDEVRGSYQIFTRNTTQEFASFNTKNYAL